MSLLEWNDELNVGYGPMDHQHQQLVATVNALYDAMLEGRGMSLVDSTFNDIVDHAVAHFQHEEKLMQESGYPDYAAHKHQHDQLMEEIVELRRSFEAGESIFSTRVLQFLADWLTVHIKTDDKALGGYLAARS
ncbi:MAG: bacteriohemerythrin [Sulfuricellaceae bacterium]|jgi:hemerythrin-like metal-binding protein